MALQYYSVQRDFPQSIPSGVWTDVVGYNVENANDGGGATALLANSALSTFDVQETGIYMLSAYCRWENGNGERLMRFIREPLTTADFFGIDERICTSGATFHSHSYQVKPSLNMLLGLQVWHSHGSNLNLDFAQFKASKIIPI